MKQDIIERRKKKLKPRGKPFPKGNKKGRIKQECSMEKMVYVDMEEKEEEFVIIPPKFIEPLESLEKKHTTPELIDCIDFNNGKNKLSIRFSKLNNRMYRIQMFLNDELQIRPVTYNGSSTGKTFWNLLKGSMKK
jgi:hypothetical protein